MASSRVAELALERLAAAAVARVLGRVGDELMLFVIERISHLGVQSLLNQDLGSCLSRPFSPIQSSGSL